MCIGGSSKIARTAEVVLRPLHAGLFGSGSAGLGDVAAKRLIPLPGMSDEVVPRKPEPSSKWRRTASSHFVLTDEAIREIRLALRADRRDRLEIVRSWVVPILAGRARLHNWLADEKVAGDHQVPMPLQSPSRPLQWPVSGRKEVSGSHRARQNVAVRASQRFRANEMRASTLTGPFG
jgi:hypothetical protein